MTEPVDFQRLFESAPHAYLVLDRDFRIVAATTAYLTATLTVREAIVGRSVFEVFPENPAHPQPEGRGSLRESLETVLRTGAPHTMPVHQFDSPRMDLSKSFRERSWRPRNTPVIHGSEVVWIIHHVEDVTDTSLLANLRTENDQTADELRSMREVDSAKDEFIAIISHELRTPMTSILGWTRMLALGGLDETTHAEALEALERSTLAQAKLIEDLLDESRIASGKLRLDLRSLDLRTAVASAVSMARPAATVKEIHLAFESGEEPYEVFGDPGRLQQAIGNLLVNAIKFTPEGGTVTVRLDRDGAAAIVEVTDTGRGISPSLLPHLFERFRQGEGQGSERQSGLGLGLSITRHLVEMHGGTVVVESPGEGLGSTFRMSLPLHHTLSPAGELVHRDSGSRALALPQLIGVRVLIVEDEADNRHVLATALRHCGAEVRCTSTAADGLYLLSEWRPDVLVCDIALPDLDGCSLLENLRARTDSEGGRTPALALTVLGRPNEHARITAAGFEVLRQKPIDPVDLAHEVARLAQPRGA